MNTFKILNQLSATNSSLEKLQILKDNQDNELLKQVFYLAYNTQIRFWIKKRPEILVTANSCVSLSSALTLLVETVASRKLTGNAAIAFVQQLLTSLSSNDQEVLLRVIERDLKCGTGTSLANKVWSKLILDYPVLLCNKFNVKTESKIKYPAICQVKMDSSRINFEFDQGKVISITTRNGQTIDITPFLDITLSNLDHFILDGELMYSLEGSDLDRKTSSGIINKAIKGTISSEESKGLNLVCWDILPYDDFIKGECPIKYVDRFFQLNNTIGSDIKRIKIVDSKIVNSKEEALAQYNTNLELGLEGCILKNADAVWSSKRSNDYLKLKNESTADLLVIGYKLGEEGTQFAGMLGSLICTTSDSKLVVNVGSGFKHKLGERDDPESYVGRIIEVKYNEVISSKNATTKSLFLPIFSCVREDKNIANSLKDLD